MERATKIIVLASVAAALTTLVWLLRPAWPDIAPLTLGAFFGSLAAFLWFGDIAVGIILLLAYVIPIGFRFLGGNWDATLWLPWLAALTAVVLPRGARTGWSLPATWKTPLVLWALVVALSWPIVAARELDFTFATLHEPHLATSYRGGTPGAAAAWIAVVASTTQVGLLLLDWLFVQYSQARPRFERRIVVPLVVGACLSSTVAIYQGARDFLFLNPTVFGALGRAGGTLLDGNALGITAAMWLPVAAAMTVDRAVHRRLEAFAWSTAVVVLAGGLWYSGSRSALLAATIGLVVTTTHAVAARARTRDALATGAALVALAAGIFVVTPASVGGPIGRIRATLDPRIQAAPVVNTLWMRDGYGGAAVRMIQDHPLAGVGVGTFNTYVRDVGLRFGWTYLEPDNAQNWWRQQLAELGVLGSLGALAWTILFLATAIFVRAERDRGRATGAAKGSIVGFAAASLVGVPGQVPLVAVTFIVLVFWVALASVPARTSAALRGRIWAAVAATVVVFLAATAVVAFSDMRPPYRALRAGWPYHYGFYADEGPTNAQFRWTTKKAVNVIPVGGRWLRVVIGGAVPPDASQKPLEVKVWRDRSLILRALRRDGSPLIRYVRMRDGAAWVMLQIETDRTWRPSEYGSNDARELGVTVAPWAFVDALPPDAVTIEEPF